MKYITAFKVFARCTLVEGGLAGITSCYETEVMDECVDGGVSTARMGAGLLTIFPVMGTALINAVGLNKSKPKGPLILMPRTFLNRVNSSFITCSTENTDIVSVNWVATENELISKIGMEADIHLPTKDAISVNLTNYIETHQPPLYWRDNCGTCLGAADA
jgi:hypothetical protein